VTLPRAVGGGRQTVDVNTDELLFATDGLPSVLEARRRAAGHALADWDPDQLLGTADVDVMDYLVAEYSVACPVLHRERTELLPVSEEIQTARGMFSGRPVEQRLTKFVLAVPFDGEKDVFKYRASNFSMNPPRAQVLAGELRLTWTGDPQASRNPATIRQYFDGQLDSIETLLASSRGDVERHNTSLRTEVSYNLAQRKARLLGERQLEAGIGFPVRQRPDAAQYAVPASRRKISTPRPTGSAAYQPEPVLPEAQYEQALAVLRNARNALERSPSMTAHLDEEKIRDLLLMSLNAQFEGAAAGELFNAAGKTDILIRAEDRNVFIAECKIWRGPKTIRDALDQLLTYLTWRDTKAALIQFIRRGQPSEIISKAVKEIEVHANYKRTVAAGEDGERYDFVLHANGDPNREIRLAFLPFALQDT
jgi:hypothetical protein